MQLRQFIDGLPSRELADGAVEIGDYMRLHRDPAVSVVMPTYNHETVVGEALESVLRQETRFVFEVVIGEDCSSDSTRAVVRDFARRHPEVIRVIASSQNVGGFRNCLRVEAAMRGKYLAYCEGDDFWHDPGKLEKQLTYLEENADCVLVHSDYNTIDNEGRTEYGVEAGRTRPHGRVFEELLRANFIATCTVCVRASAIHAFRACSLASPDFPIGDWARWLFASRQGNVEYRRESLATYRLTPGSLTRSGPKASLELRRSCAAMQREARVLFGCKPDTWAVIERENNVQLLSLAMVADDRQHFRKEFAWMLHKNRAWLRRGGNLALAALYIARLYVPARRVKGAARSLLEANTGMWKR